MALKTDRAPLNPPKTPAKLSPCEVVAVEVAKYSDWDAGIMAAIAQAENRTCDPLRHNLDVSETHLALDGSIVCIGSYNVLQVGCVHYQPGENKDDLVTNVKVANRVWRLQGYNAWTMYRNGEYLKHLR